MKMLLLVFHKTPTIVTFFVEVCFTPFVIGMCYKHLFISYMPIIEKRIDTNHRYLIIPRWLTSNHRPIYKVKPRYLLQM